MRSLLAFALSLLCASTGLSVVSSNSPELEAFLANAWSCLDRDIPEDVSNLRLKEDRVQLKHLLERMGRFSQVMNAELRVSESVKNRASRADYRKKARDRIATLEEDAARVAAFGKASVPSLDSEASKRLFQRALEELQATRNRIAEAEKKDGEPGATDNPGDAQRLREDH